MIESIFVPLISGLIGGLAVLSGSLIALKGRRDSLKEQYGVERSVVSALQHFLSLDQLPYRSFGMIRHHIGGFESNELRQLLVRAGAIRFMAADGTEMWALLDRVSEEFKLGRRKLSETPRNVAAPEELFPQALGNESDY